MKIIEQTVTYSAKKGVDSRFVEYEVKAENDTQYIIDTQQGFKIVAKDNEHQGWAMIGETVNHNFSIVDEEHLSVVRYKLDDDEHDFDFYEIASREFAKFELTKDLWVNRNGEIEPRRSEVKS